MSDQELREYGAKLFLASKDSPLVTAFVEGCKHAVSEAAAIAEGVAERNTQDGKVFTERALTAQVIRDKIRAIVSK